MPEQTEKAKPAEIAREAVVSANIRAVGYEEASHTLAIEFMNGHVWHYHEVPKEKVTEFLGSGSKGGYFARAIRGRFKETRIA